MSVWPEQQVLGVDVTVITGDKYLNSSLCLDGSWKIFTVDGNWSYLLYKPECTSQWDSKEWVGYRRQIFVCERVSTRQKWLTKEAGKQLKREANLIMETKWNSCWWKPGPYVLTNLKLIAELDFQAGMPPSMLTLKTLAFSSEGEVIKVCAVRQQQKLIS